MLGKMTPNNSKLIVSDRCAQDVYLANEAIKSYAGQLKIIGIPMPKYKNTTYVLQVSLKGCRIIHRQHCFMAQ